MIESSRGLNMFTMAEAIAIAINDVFWIVSNKTDFKSVKVRVMDILDNDVVNGNYQLRTLDLRNADTNEPLPQQYVNVGEILSHMSTAQMG